MTERYDYMILYVLNKKKYNDLNYVDNLINTALYCQQKELMNESIFDIFYGSKFLNEYSVNGLIRTNNSNIVYENDIDMLCCKHISINMGNLTETQIKFIKKYFSLYDNYFKGELNVGNLWMKKISDLKICKRDSILINCLLIRDSKNSSALFNINSFIKFKDKNPNKTDVSLEFDVIKFDFDSLRDEKEIIFFDDTLKIQNNLS